MAMLSKTESNDLFRLYVQTLGYEKYCQSYNPLQDQGKSKTIYVYFIKQKLFGYSPSSVLLKQNLILLFTLHKN